MNVIPSLGMATFRLEGDDACNSVEMALETGYRHIDTAQIYGNEAEVGRAIAGSGIVRGDIFLTTKVWLDNLGEQAFIPSVEESLAKLRVEAVYLLLIYLHHGQARACSCATVFHGYLAARGRPQCIAR